MEATNKKQGEQPLGPYRALDLADEKGFLCGHILAELGCDVIKVERPGGDAARKIGPFYEDVEDPQKSLFWFAYNRSKRGITLDIATTRGREILLRLAERADFVIESHAPGYLDSIGLGYADLCKIRPSIIVTSISAFGQTGPHKDYKDGDLVAMAMGGFMYITGEPDRPPLRISVDQSYLQAGAQAALGTLIAHYYRRMTGEGQHIDVALQESILPSAWFAPYYWEHCQIIQNRIGGAIYRERIPRRHVFRCKDGYVSWQLLVGGLGSKTRNMVEWMEAEGMAGELADLQWEKLDYEEMAYEQFQEWEREFEAFFMTKTKGELYQKSLEKGMILMPGNDISDLLQSPQLAARDFWTKVEHPELNDSIVYPGAPFVATEEFWKVRDRAPLIGEHNREIYMEELGLSSQELEVLAQQGVI